MLDKLNAAMNVTVILLVGFFLFRPGGLVPEYVGDWREQARVRQQIERTWNEMIYDAGRIGAEEGSVVLLEFGDYQCPYCIQNHADLKRFVEKNPTASIVYRHLPLTAIHSEAEPAARASICAERFGKFDEMHDRLYSETEWHTDPNWNQEALAVGISDTLGFANCLNDARTNRRIELDQELAEQMGIRSTPSFVTLDGIHRGVISSERLAELVP